MEVIPPDLLIYNPTQTSPDPSNTPPDTHSEPTERAKAPPGPLSDLDKYKEWPQRLTADAGERPEHAKSMVDVIEAEWVANKADRDARMVYRHVSRVDPEMGYILLYDVVLELCRINAARLQAKRESFEELVRYA